MKSKNMVSTGLPAVTVCNQNSIQCSKLLSLMLDKLQANDVLLYNDLEQLYLLSQCAFKSLKCDKVLEEYQEHFKDGSKVPEALMKGDTCMDCEVMLKMWSEECEEEERPPQPYDYWWNRNECAKSLSDSKELLKSLKQEKPPDSLAECPKKPEPPMTPNSENSSSSLLQTPSGNNSTLFSLDDLLEEFQNCSRESNSSSTPPQDLDEHRNDTKSDLPAATDTPLDEQSNTDKGTSGQTENVRDPDASVSYKR